MRAYFYKTGAYRRIRHFSAGLGWPRLALASLSLAMEDLLTADDAAKVHHRLMEAAPRAAEIGERLGLQRERIDRIKSENLREEDQLHKVIVAFLGQAEPKPTWRVILEALRSAEVNLSPLADRIENTYFQPR